MTEKPCKDCLAENVTTKRKSALAKDGSQVPGSRCITHERARKKVVRAAAHGNRVEKTYGITPEEYDAIYEHQGGFCFICQRARGISKKLAVDHDHDKCTDHPPDVGCRNCVRCLACTTCNNVILGRYDESALVRALIVLGKNPPAQKVLNP